MSKLAGASARCAGKAGQGRASEACGKEVTLAHDEGQETGKGASISGGVKRGRGLRGAPGAEAGRVRGGGTVHLQDGDLRRRVEDRITQEIVSARRRAECNLIVT